MKSKSLPVEEKRKGPTPYGKRSDPDYGQHNVYLPNALFAKVTRKLINSDGTRGELSGLVEGLLRLWLKPMKSPNIGKRSPK